MVNTSGGINVGFGAQNLAWNFWFFGGVCEGFGRLLCLFCEIETHIQW